jgi:hypothetical protein
MLVDAVNVPPEHRFSTLTPFIVGLVLAAIGYLSQEEKGKLDVFPCVAGNHPVRRKVVWIVYENQVLFDLVVSAMAIFVRRDKPV